MVEEIFKTIKQKMTAAIDHLEERLKGIRTGRAQVSLVEDIRVDYYGSKQPLKTLAQITTPEANLILVQPFDLNSLGDIRLAIINADLGFNPADDGRTLHIPVPPLTEERRNEMVKLIQSLAEETKISLRNAREEGWKEIRKLAKDHQISEDDLNWGKESLDKMIGEKNEIIGNLAKEKELAIKKI